MTELSKHAILYMPEKENSLRGIIQIVHDMGEYQGRYRELAQFLSNQGFAVITSDLIGHGNHMPRMNELGFFGDNALSRLIGDIHENTRYIREQFPNVPYFLLGHGLGAWLATVYFKRYDNFINGLFLSGIPSDRSSRIIGSILIRLYIVFRGEYFRSKIVDSLVMGPYYKKFAREGSPSAWLTQDPEALQSYDSDPKCGFIYTLNGYRSVMEIADAVFTSGSWIRKNLNCPVRILCGTEDPCLVSQPSFVKSVHLFSDQGYKNTAYMTYPGLRHDIFQEHDKETVFEDVLTELNNILEGVQPEEEPDNDMEKAPVHIVLDDFIDPEVVKPFEDPEEKINLEEFINAHNEAHPAEAAKDASSKVEMIDFVDIEAFINPDSKPFLKPEFEEYISDKTAEAGEDTPS